MRGRYAKERAYRHLHMLPLPNDVKRGRTKWPCLLYIPRGQRGGAIIAHAHWGAKTRVSDQSGHTQELHDKHRHKQKDSYSIRA